MPELPEVHALSQDLAARLDGRAFVRVDITAISALKTYDPPISALVGRWSTASRGTGSSWTSPGGGVHLVDPPGPGRLDAVEGGGRRRWSGPGKGADRAADRAGRRLRVRPDRGGHAEEARGVRRPRPGRGAGHRAARARPVSDDFARGLQRDPHRGGRVQLKGVLRNQTVIAGIGNAYSDEILHVAKMSPFKPASTLTDDELKILYDAMRENPPGRGGALRRPRRAGPEVGEEVRPAGARPQGREVPGLRRHRPRGLASPTRRCSTAPPARQVASRWPTEEPASS